MINYTHEKSLEDLDDISLVIKSIKKNHNIDSLKIAINPGIFLISRRSRILLSFTTSPIISEVTNYETLWDSLIFAIMGADAKADIIDSVDIERITTAAIATVKKLASARDENQRVAEAFQNVANNRNINVTHELKILPEFFSAVVEGRKKAELRVNDRGFEVNDFLLLKEWNGGTGIFTGREVKVQITDVTAAYFSEPNLVMLSFDVPVGFYNPISKSNRK